MKKSIVLVFFVHSFMPMTLLLNTLEIISRSNQQSSNSQAKRVFTFKGLYKFLTLKNFFFYEKIINIKI